MSDVPDALLAAIYDNPADDAPRMVYADWLAERDDPRGELIALQLQPTLTWRQRTRCAAVVARHAPEWLGPLADVVDLDTCTFERGFLAACRIDPMKLARARGAVLGRPEWSTVTRLGLGHSSYDDTLDAELVFHPTMKALRGLTDVSSAATLELLSRDRIDLEELDSEGPRGSWATATEWRHDPAELSAWSTSKAFRCLSRLSFPISYNNARMRPADSTRWLWTTPLAANLTRLDLRVWRLGIRNGIAPWVQELVETMPARVATLELGGFDLWTADRFWLRFSRTGDDKLSLQARVNGISGSRPGLTTLELATILDRLAPGSLARSEITTTPGVKLDAREADRLRSTLERLSPRDAIAMARG